MKIRKQKVADPDRVWPMLHKKKEKMWIFRLFTISPENNITRGSKVTRLGSSKVKHSVWIVKYIPWIFDYKFALFLYINISLYNMEI